MKIRLLLLLFLVFFTSSFTPPALFGSETKVVARLFCTDKEWSELWQAYNRLPSKEKSGKSPLFFALEMNKNSVAKELVLVYGYDAFPDLISCLRESISHNFDELPLLMIEQGLDPSFGNSLLLSYAAKWGREELVLKLLSLGVDPNGMPQWAWPALNELATNSTGKDSTEKKQSNLRIAKALIASGSDVNDGSRHGYGNTPLYIACSSCYGPDFGFVQFLLDVGADPNIVESSTGRTPFLHLFWLNVDCHVDKWIRRDKWIAAHFEHKYFWTQDCLECLQLFISFGVDVNLRDKKGNTALIYLLQKHPGNISMKILELLLESGADPFLPGLTPLLKTHYDWLTPMEYARAPGFEKYFEYMTEYMIAHSDPWIERYVTK